MGQEVHFCFWDLLRSGGGRRRVLSHEEQTVQDFGKDLFNALVGGEVRSRFDVSLREARQQQENAGEQKGREDDVTRF